MKKDNEKLLKKIKKLLALSKSSNPHEAAKALEIAQKLMAEHNVNSIDVEISESDSKQKFSRKTGEYVHALASLIERAFGVKAYFSNRSDTFGSNKMHAVFFGQEERPIVASYCFDVLYRKLQQARKEFIATQSKRLKRSTLISRADNYCFGWVQGVYVTIKDFALTPEEVGKIQQYSDELHRKMNLSKAKVRKVGDTRERNGDDSGLKGYMDGKKVKMNHGVSGQETLKISNQ
ncbi:TPA: DUF2786 domain-containing protein [Pasteurella multocida]|uniref:DUF2786 domain-containing protein n=1 Tax=Pasteurella multocida TaxID=747 RepID=UPI0007764487|nr:DUF2786 domain-containing protein [Pasteurella multocida]AMM81395.1 hypothetical protein AW43_02925 [Pasteurella multocida subsp. multocida PMTB2.1]HDR1414500.1 DUF2786 domain-containing protein [Pasteurella multocida]HEA3289912.1 DUF2786 domain-containing protein [Pasteurella multocida]